MTDPRDADVAALKAIEGALALPNGDALAVLRLYRVQCEKAERERVLKEVEGLVGDWFIFALNCEGELFSGDDKTEQSAYYANELAGLVARLRGGLPNGVTLDLPSKEGT